MLGRGLSSFAAGVWGLCIDHNGEMEQTQRYFEEWSDRIDSGGEQRDYKELLSDRVFLCMWLGRIHRWCRI